MIDDEKFQEIVRAHELDAFCQIDVRDAIVQEILNRESTLITMVEQLRKDKAGLVEAIEWACGILDEFIPTSDKRYWWRNELCKRAGLKYNDGCTALITDGGQK